MENTGKTKGSGSESLSTTHSLMIQFVSGWYLLDAYCISLNVPNSMDTVSRAYFKYSLSTTLIAGVKIDIITNGSSLVLFKLWTLPIGLK